MTVATVWEWGKAARW